MGTPLGPKYILYNYMDPLGGLGWFRAGGVSQTPRPSVSDPRLQGPSPVQ